MPSGPKKRRAARKKSDGDASFTHPAADVKVEADAELSKIIVSKVSEVSIADVHAEAKPEIGLKENEGKEIKEQTFFEDSAIEQSLVNQNLTKCSQMSFRGDLEDVKVHAELSKIIVSKVSEVSIADVHAEAKPEIGLKENEGKETDEQTFFEDSVILQSLLNQNLTKCSQMSLGGDLEGIKLESILEPFDLKVHAELSEIIVSKVSEVSTADVHAEAKPEISLKENEGKESEEQTFFENSVIEQSLLNQNLTKCSQIGDLEVVTLESIVQPLAEPVVDSDAADSLLESVQKEANGAFDKQLENGFNAPKPSIYIAGDAKNQADQEIRTLLEQLLLLSTEGDMLAQKQMEVNKKVGQIHHKILDELKSLKRT